MAFFSQEKIDYFPVALIIGTVAILFIISTPEVGEDDIVNLINFNTLIFIFAMQIIIYFATEDKVLEYIAVKLIHVTKGNNRLLFYFICLFTGTLVAFIEDLTLSLILVPLIYRTCRALRIPSGTYMMGMTISINIGAILTPVSSLKNLLIGQEFGWDFLDYFMNMGLLFVIILLSTIFLMDWFILRKEEKPTQTRKDVLLALLDPKIVILDRGFFKLTFIILIGTFAFMIAGFSPPLVAILSAAILMLIHWRKIKFSEMKKDIAWKIIIVFAIIFILSNSLAGFGFSELISNALITVIGNNLYLAVLITLGISSLMSAFLAGTPVTIILLPIISSIAGSGLFPAPIVIAFISGVNMAGNFLPQGSACDMLTLSLAKKFRVKNLDYKRLLKYGSIFALLHFIIAIVYTIFYTMMFS
ncbi:MAG: SLC13 family permease [Promethearchaeota archaeon]